MASVELPASCLVDTTFLIHLVTPKGEFHANALNYFQALQSRQTRFYLPTLVMAEYAVKGGRDGVAAVLGTLGAQVCGFDMAAALRYGELSKDHPGVFNLKKPDQERTVVDLMLVAIAQTLGLEGIVTSDKNLCGPFLKGTKIRALDIKYSVQQITISLQLDF